MRILSRYLLRLHIGPFIFGLTGLTMLLLLDQVSKRFEKLVGKGLGWSVIAKVFAYSIPFILAQTFPMAVLIAVLYVFNRLAVDHEITAMKAGGVPLTRLLAPLLVAAVGLAAVMTAFNNTILPESNHRLQLLMTSIAQKKPTFQLREHTINEVLPSRLYVQVARIDRSRGGLEDVVIYDERGGNRSRTIYADRGRMAYNPAHTDLYLTLDSGVLQERLLDKPTSFQRTHFRSLIMRVAGVGNELKKSELDFRGDREMTIGQMRREVRTARQRMEEARAESRGYALALTELLSEGAVEDTAVADSLISATAARAALRSTGAAQTISQFDGYQVRLEQAEGTSNQYRVEIHKKYTIPAACIVFVLIGAPIALKFPQGGVALVVGVSLLVFSAYYVALVGGEELSDDRILSPFWAMWAPNVLFGLIGIGAVWQARRAGR
ncbi:MAG: LptF/LptG family permease [Gemmatimonadota bacterium]